MRRSLAVAAVVVSVALTSSAIAGPNDCIKDGGPLVCTDPIVTGENISLCDETASYLYRSNMATTCGWGNPTTDVGSAVAKMNCFEGGLSGCSASAQWPGWSTPGQSHNSYWCWNVTTNIHNGIVNDEWAVTTSTTVYKDAQGACSKSGGFSVPILAWKHKTLACPPGFNTAMYPNGDWKCFQCPAHSTWNGNDCVCDTGYVKRIESGLCEIACTQDSDCDDHDYCNGDEYCLGGYCLHSQPIDCNDSKVCTLDRCDGNKNVCINELDPSLCRCDEPGDLKASANADVKLPFTPTLSCPSFIGGDASASLKVKGEFQKTLPTCGNGCSGKSSSELEAFAELKACSKPSKIGGKLKYVNETQKCPTCTDNCAATCTGASCEKNTATGTLKEEIEPEFKGLKKDFKLGSFGYGISCGAKYTANLATTVEYQGSGPNGDYKPGPGCGACNDCSTVTTKLGGGGGLKGSCELKGLPPDDPKKPGAGCLGCFEGSVGVAGTATGKWGGCGSESCFGVRTDAEAKAEAKVSLQYGWFKATGSCKFVAKGCSEASNCSTCSCKDCQDVSVDTASCSVTPGVAGGGK